MKNKNSTWAWSSTASYT